MFNFSRQNSDNIIFLENSAVTGDTESYLFLSPLEIITANSYAETESAFEKIENRLKENYCIAGFFSYELGYFFDDFFKDKIVTPSNFPLLYLGVYKKATLIKQGEKSKIKILLKRLFNKIYSKKNFKISGVELSESYNDYRKKITQIKKSLVSGDVYQANYTIKYKFKFSGNPYLLYESLKNAQPVNYGVFMKFGDAYIISLSPELFFKKNGLEITCKPMKGTIKRGVSNYEDGIQLKRLLRSEKEKAENLMIVDLIRNDIGKIAGKNGVEVKELFQIEKYRSVFQMTSTVAGVLKKDSDYKEIFKALFPCGSVTGAPKLSAMNLIYRLENEPRNAYCGAIGAFFPDKKAVFNVAIRTVMIRKGLGELGIGGGITIGSSAKKEFEECLLKSNFFLNAGLYKQFKLLESILWKNSRFKYIQEHLSRLSESARYFGFKFEKEIIEKKITEYARKNFIDKKAYKTRILLNESGMIRIIKKKLCSIDFNKKKLRFITMSVINVDSKNAFLYHKTTNRKFYNSEYKKYRKAGFYDVIFKNENDEITEGSFNNIAVKLNGKFYTPPFFCGLLDGIMRKKLIEEKKNY
ncbi:MAG TPA: aminodeoxychorismate synthase component I [bacterium]|nr:aminodeoxychorismate synthase component I [bacterium]HPN32690.1 aminodeoxychorismate synthase component I [bacterium]